MKRLAEIGQRPRYGYLAPCKHCGKIVVHAESTGEPFHMHQNSEQCRKLAERRRAVGACGQRVQGKRA